MENIIQMRLFRHMQFFFSYPSNPFFIGDQELKGINYQLVKIEFTGHV